MIIHRLYANKQEAQERIKKIKEIGYKNAAAIDLGDSGVRIKDQLEEKQEEETGEIKQETTNRVF